ncbi:hypothetical protein AM1_B0115 (plasmid) [Acaryochloris marina MBIC11017]|uniref:Uncharacterized protein n=1 Tax=Acaryochloris marina (strain MBIC 11017) TaxID=329726 RepID=A8ZM71_ACAM1|nr:hypothetical protein AM1_B0115 [Acaryochloris marina MBIC11017]
MTVLDKYIDDLAKELIENTAGNTPCLPLSIQECRCPTS